MHAPALEEEEGGAAVDCFSTREGLPAFQLHRSCCRLGPGRGAAHLAPHSYSSDSMAGKHHVLLRLLRLLLCQCSAPQLVGQGSAPRLMMEQRSGGLLVVGQRTRAAGASQAADPGYDHLTAAVAGLQKKYQVR